MDTHIKTDRLLYADALRAFAIILVVIIHVAAYPVVSLAESASYAWWIANFFDSVARPAVPLFIMLSGLLLLNPSRQESPLTFLRRRMTRILIPFITWALVYFFWRHWYHGESISPLPLLHELLNGPVYTHFWFVYMLVGLYLLIPLLQVFVRHASQQHIRYFLVLWFITVSLLPLLNKFTGIPVAIYLGTSIHFTGYLILGHVLSTVSLKQNQIRWGLAGLLLLTTVTAVGTYLTTQQASGVLDEYFYNNFSPNLIGMSILWFIVIKSINFSVVRDRFHYIWLGTTTLASTSYGIYLVHPLIQEILQGGMLGGLTLSANSFNPATAIPVTMLVIVLFSAIAVTALQFFKPVKIIAT